MVRVLTVAVLVAVAVFALAAPAGASRQVLVTGGGTGTFAADLDGDGDIDGSYFGFNVVVAKGGTTRGTFTCVMAGKYDFLGLPVMAVQGTVDAGSVESGAGASFAGTGTVNLGNGVIFRDVRFEVTVTEGGPGQGTLTLTVLGVFDGVAGDTQPGDGNYSLPAETVATGGIRISG